MPYNGHVLGDSLPYQFRIPDATTSHAGVMSPADKAKLAGFGICSMGANETTYNDGNTYGIGVAGGTSDPSTAAPFLLAHQQTPTTISLFATIAPSEGQTLRARCFYSPDQGATDSQLGELTLQEGEKYVAETLPGTVILPAGSYLRWTVDLDGGDSGNLTTTLTTSVG